MISQEAIQTILGIKEKVQVTPEEMADHMNVVFFPNTSKNISKQVIDFRKRLESTLSDLKVNIVPYSDALERVPFGKTIKRLTRIVGNNLLFSAKKILGISHTSYFIDIKTAKILLQRAVVKRGIAIVSLGEENANDLPMHYIRNFKDNSVITILDFPKDISEETEFEKHFDTAMSLFAYHMTNIIIAVDNEKWMVYNFNASHPIYNMGESDEIFKKRILHALVPKVVAPISPHKFKEFKIKGERFNPAAEPDKSIIEDLAKGALLFDETKLFPDGKKIDDLPFRNSFHKIIGKLHLDNRNGMSFGFFAKQMPTMLSNLVSDVNFREKNMIPNEQDFFIDENKEIYISVNIKNQKFWLKVPEVWVMSLRSGSNKTHFDPNKDLIKLGLLKGEMWMEFPIDLKINTGYKPSFDTKVILAHAVGNAIIASILKHFDKNKETDFAKILSEKGYSISHWHGYFKKDLIPENIGMYGEANPHVACSSPQSAIYALGGKLENFNKIFNENKVYAGDIHVEPHHGSNISFPSLTKLAEYLIQYPEASKLGNKYLNYK
ncbi:MAG: hypothetical protein PHF79_00945 [Candidatus Pacebacteria bacterium]|nr:hypothetical protein [Candidatus Paceibacterota bacterium]